MKSKISKVERRSIIADLKASYMYILIPFILLVGIKLYTDSWISIILAPDWSLASSIICGQIAASVSKAVSHRKSNTNEHQFSWYTAKRFLLVVISLSFYFAMLLKPTMELGYAQIILFFIASYLFFSDGVTTYLLKRN
jgi:hypothetical protein